jgi:GNAT superfamily N-acetyltransferase
MRTKTVSKLVRNLTPDEYKKCKNLNFREGGHMMYDLPWAKKKHPDRARVVMIKDESNRLLAWCLAYPGADKYEGEFITQYYTRVKFRRQGYGDRLIKHIKKHTKYPVVLPHDRASRNFFNKHKSEVTINKVYLRGE